MLNPFSNFNCVLFVFGIEFTCRNKMELFKYSVSHRFALNMIDDMSYLMSFGFPILLISYLKFCA